MEAAWVTAMITEAIAMHGRHEIIKSDQGSQWRAIDNVIIERFWRTLKHDHLYLAPPTDGLTLYRSCERFVHRYNNRQLHSSLDYRTPAAFNHMAA
jgi:putative transposase